MIIYFLTRLGQGAAQKVCQRSDIFLKLSEHLLRTSFKNIEVAAKSCSVKKVFLEISKNSQENACARVYFLIKLQVLGL